MDAVHVPVPYRVVARVEDTADVATLSLEPVADPIPRPVPGQFTMLSAFGTTEAPISVSGLPDADRPLRHTIRSAGLLTTGLAAATEGDVLGVRGPFGTGWPIPAGDVVVVAGGIGLAPLLPAIRLLDRRPAGRLALLVGARSPSNLLAAAELGELASRHPVGRTVDAGDEDWDGEVGVVTELLPRVPFAFEGASALVCGPEVMIRFAARALVEVGMAAERVAVSLERNMHCGRGACGHCQLGPLFLCTDGPVVSWASAEDLVEVRSR